MTGAEGTPKSRRTVILANGTLDHTRNECKKPVSYAQIISPAALIRTSHTNRGKVFLIRCPNFLTAEMDDTHYSPLAD